MSEQEKTARSRFAADNPKALRAGFKAQIEKIDGPSQQAKAVGQPGSSQVSKAAA